MGRPRGRGPVAVLAVVFTAGSAAAPSRAADKPIVLGTSQDADTLAGKLQRRIFGEAFKRMDIPLQLVVMPLQRLSAAADQGQIDGDVARVQGYGAAHPELVRVEEPVYDVVWSLFATDPALTLTSLTALPAQPWRATYLRGVGVCESALKAALPAERLIDVTSDAQGFNMLRLSRSDVHCTADLSALTLQYTAEFKGVDILRRVVDIGVFPLHAYLHRRNAELAPRLAATLKQMKADGTLNGIRADAIGELERR